VLAAKVPKPSANRLVYVFTIRSGVRFSNGDALTPADVVWSMERVLAKHSTYPYAGIFGVKSVSQQGAHKVAVTLTAPDWSWLFDLAAYSNGVILDKRVDTPSQLGTDPIGTGPYTVKSSNLPASISLGINHDYWGPKPPLAGVEFEYFTSAAAQNGALQSGGINAIDYFQTPAELGTFTHDPNFVVLKGLTNGKVQLTLNNSWGPLRNVLVRRAIAYATDKKAVIQVAAGGQGIAAASDTVPDDPYYVNLENKYPYDPAKARKLLKQAGYPHGFSLTITLPNIYFYATLAGPVLQSEFNAVGIHTKLTTITWPNWIADVFEGPQSFEATIIDHAEARDVANYATTGYYWHYKDTAQVAKMLATANAAPTQGKWIGGMKAILRKITSDAVNDWLYVFPASGIHWKGLIGLPKNFYGDSFDLAYARFGGSLPPGAAGLGYSTK
jgi:peptide/nickel transport system substrate-binding protein